MLELDLDRLQETVVECIAKQQFGDAMTRIKLFVEEVINDPETVGVVLASRELDSLCETLADAYYCDRHGEPANAGRGTVILASELVKAGGHVELIKDYLALELFEAPVRVALTDLFNRIDRDHIDEWEALLGCEVFIAEESSLGDKLGVLTARLAEWKPCTIVSVGHNQDVVCVMSAFAPGAGNRY